MRMTAGSRLAFTLLSVCLGYAGAAGAAATPPLVDAARDGDTAAVRALLAQGAGVDVAEGDGTTALHWASYRDDIETVGLLLDAGADVNATNDLGTTPLWAAGQNGSATMVRRLLTAGANPNLALLAGERPLMVAARSGAPDVVELLLTHGAETEARGARGQTALMWAVAQHHASVVTVLLANGADVHARSDVWSQMMGVPPHGQPEYNRQTTHGGNTALMFAARVGGVGSARPLIAAGANVDDTDARGVSATTLAAHAGFGDLVELLLENGAEPNAAEAGFDALHAAVRRRDRRMVGALLGLVAGLFVFPPIGLIVGPFIGAMGFEWAFGREARESAKAGVGAVLGLALGVVGKLVCSVVMFALFAFKAWPPANSLPAAPMPPPIVEAPASETPEAAQD